MLRKNSLNKIAGFIFLTLLQLCINAQEVEESIRDSVFLKNGNIISGTVLNPGSESNIQFVREEAPFCMFLKVKSNELPFIRKLQYF